MHHLFRLLTGSALFALSFLAAQAENAWSVRLRATYLSTVDHSDPFSALGIAFPADIVSVDDKLIPEIDVNYAFNDRIVAELVLTIPQSQDVTLKGVGKLGTFKHLPPTLLVKYRALPGSSVRPYVGVGVNYTLIWDDRLSVAGVPLKLENDSVGLAAQVGVDIRLRDRWTLNFDVKKAAIRSNVYAGSANLTEARLDPWLFAAGAEYHF